MGLFQQAHEIVLMNSICLKQDQLCVIAQQIQMIQNAIKTKKLYWNEMKLPRFNYKVSNEDEERLCVQSQVYSYDWYGSIN